jgi:hypothetical protein
MLSTEEKKQGGCMKIEMTKEEYRELLDVLYAAEWVFHAYDAGQHPRTKRYNGIIQKLYALAHAYDLERLIKYDKNSREYYPTGEFEDTTEVWKFIDDLTDETFWDELIHRLTDRDIARTVGGYEQMDQLNRREFSEIERPILDRYSAEFDERGLERLEIVESFAPVPAHPSRTHD